jgi:hypothetical protein
LEVTLPRRASAKSAHIIKSDARTMVITTGPPLLPLIHLDRRLVLVLALGQFVSTRNLLEEDVLVRISLREMCDEVWLFELFMLIFFV